MTDKKQSNTGKFSKRRGHKVLWCSPFIQYKLYLFKQACDQERRNKMSEYRKQAARTSEKESILCYASVTEGAGHGNRLYFSSFEVAMEVIVVMVVMAMVGTATSLKMDCVTPECDTLFSLSVPMIICRISLLASPRTASSAWMCSSLQRAGGTNNLSHV